MPTGPRKSKSRVRIQKAFKGVLHLHCGKVVKAKDFTVYIDRRLFIETVKEAFKDPHQVRSDVKDASSEEVPWVSPLQDDCPETIDLSGKVNVNSRGKEGFACRVHAALCFGAEYYSVTVRKELSPCQKWIPKNVFSDHTKWGKLKRDLVFTSINEGEWELRPGEFASSLCGIAEILFPAIFGEWDEGPANGLVLITGGTGSGKTTVLNGLLGRY